MEEDPGTGEQIILEEEIDENYEPTDNEIREYADWLGMDVEAEKELLWIARAGLKAALPPEWKPCKTPAGEIYYFNFSTGESIWDHPCDEQYRNLYEQEKAKRQHHHHQQQQQQLLAPPPSQMPLLPSASGEMGAAATVSTTRVEPWQKPQSSPSGTLSTVPSIINSMPPSPTGLLPGQANGLGRDQSSKGPTPTLSRSTSQAGGVGFALDMGWRLQDKMADEEARKLYRQQLLEERSRWELAARAELQAQQETRATALKAEQEQWIWSLQQQVEEERRVRAAAMHQELELRLREARAALEAQNGAVLDQLQARQQEELVRVQALHATTLEALQRQQQEQVQAATVGLQEAALKLAAPALSGAELEGVLGKALDAAREEAASEAAVLKQQLLEEKQKQVEDEVQLSLSQYRTSRCAEALSALGKELPDQLAATVATLGESNRKLAELEAAIADKAAVLQQLDDKEQQLASSPDKMAIAAAEAAAAQLAACKAKLAAAQQELQDQDQKLLAKKGELAAAEVAAASQQQELAAAEAQAADARCAQTAAINRVTNLAAEQESRSTELAYTSECLGRVKAELASSEEELKRVEAAVVQKRAALQSTVSELGKRRSQMSGLGSGFSDALRRQMDEEGKSMEERLARTKAALIATDAQLHAQQAALASLDRQVTSAQGQLAAVEASLLAKRAELEGLLRAAHAEAHREFKEGKSLLLEEEVRLLAAARASMEGRVAAQVEGEGSVRLTAARRRMAADVEVQVAREQATLLAQRQEQVADWLVGQSSSPAGARAHNAIGFPGLQLRPATSTSVLTQSVGESESLSPCGRSGSVAAVAAAAEALRLNLAAAQQALAGASGMRGAGDGPGTADTPDNADDDDGSSEGAPTDFEEGSAGPTGRQHPGGLATAKAIASTGGLGFAPGGLPLAPGWPPHLQQEQRDYYGELLAGASHFIRQQRCLLKQRQATLLAAQTDWREGLAAVEAAAAAQQQQQQGLEGERSKGALCSSPCREGSAATAADGPAADGGAPGAGGGRASSDAGGGCDAAVAEVARQQALSGLRQLKVVLQEQVHQLNTDTRLLRQLKAQVKALQQALPASPSPPAAAAAAQGVLRDILLGAQPAASSMHVPFQLPAFLPRRSSMPLGASGPGALQPDVRMLYGQVDRPGSRSGVRPRLSLGGLARPWGPEGEDSLSKMASALADALAATRGLGGTSSSSSIRAVAASGFGAVPATLASPARGGAGGGGTGSSHPRGVGSGRGSSGWQVDVKAGPTPVAAAAVGSQASSEGFGTSLGYLSKWKDDRQAAQGTLAQHSQWLASFHAQIAQMAALTSPPPAAAGTSGALQQQQQQHHSLLAAGAAAGGQGNKMLRAQGSTSGPVLAGGPGGCSWVASCGSGSSALLVPLQPSTPPLAPGVAPVATGAAAGAPVSVASVVESDAGTGSVGGSMPMRVPLGGNQELLISLVAS